MIKKLILTVVVVLFLATFAFAGEGQYPFCYNVTLTNADTEYSQQLAAGARKMTMQCRTAYDVRFAYITGNVAASTDPFMTLKSGVIYWEDDISTKMEKQTIYFASSEAGTIVELLVWY